MLFPVLFSVFFSLGLGYTCTYCKWFTIEKTNVFSKDETNKNLHYKNLLMDQLFLPITRTQSNPETTALIAL